MYVHRLFYGVATPRHRQSQSSGSGCTSGFRHHYQSHFCKEPKRVHDCHRSHGKVGKMHEVDQMEVVDSLCNVYDWKRTWVVLSPYSWAQYVDNMRLNYLVWSEKLVVLWLVVAILCIDFPWKIVLFSRKILHQLNRSMIQQSMKQPDKFNEFSEVCWHFSYPLYSTTSRLPGDESWEQWMGW